MVTADTNIAFYSKSNDQHASVAQATIASCDFLSVQVLNEFALASRCRLNKTWADIGNAVDDFCALVPDIRPIKREDNHRAVNLVGRYRLHFYDALLIAVAVANGATTLFSEDMHHGLLIDDTLRIVDPFRSDLTL